MKHKRFCKSCQQVFYGHRAQYCSPECRAKENTRACFLCGQSFVATKSTKVYCSSACQQKAIRVRKVNIVASPYRTKSYSHDFNPSSKDPYSWFEREEDRRQRLGRKRL